MTIQLLKHPAVIRDIENAYKLKTLTVEELATYYGVSKSKIRTILAEAGLVQQASYKTKKEAQLLEYLKLHSIDSVDQLRAKLLTSTSVKNAYNKLPLTERVKWLNDSVQPTQGQSHAVLQHLQHS